MNGLKIQWAFPSEQNLSRVNFPTFFDSKNYFAVGVLYNDDLNMTNNAYEAQIFPSRYYRGYIEFGGVTSIKRRVFAILVFAMVNNYDLTEHAIIGNVTKTNFDCRAGQYATWGRATAMFWLSIGY